jgi:hypothetical protein
VLYMVPAMASDASPRISRPCRPSARKANLGFRFGARNRVPQVLVSGAQRNACPVSPLGADRRIARTGRVVNDLLRCRMREG